MRSLKSFFVLVFLLGLVLPQGAIAHQVKIPHWIELTCKLYEAGEYGYPGCSAGTFVRWEPIEGASSYYVEDLQAGYDTTYPHPTDRRGLGGCGPCGWTADCCYEQRLNFNKDYASTQSRYQVFANFPEETGNLEVSKKTTAKGIVYPGDTIGYSFTYKNTGKGVLSDAEIIETLPAYIELVSGGSSHVGQEVRWNIGTLNAGQGGTVHMQVKIDKNLPPSIDTIYNVAVTHLGGTTDTVGLGIGLCDSFISQVVYGDVEWSQYPDPSYKYLHHKDDILGQDYVRANTGMATFDHSIVGGALVLSQGGFTPKLCNLLDYPVISELTLDDGSSIQHSVGGILNDDEHVLVLSEYLKLNIHDGDYTLDSSGGIETVKVKRGKLTVIDPDNNSTIVSAGESFSWPTPPAVAGPQITETIPGNLQSLDYQNFAITYVFDQPVTSLSGDSLFFYSMACNMYTFYGTLDGLVAAWGDINYSWNDTNTELTIAVNNGNPYRLGERYQSCDVTVTTQFKDVVGASGSSDSLTSSLHLFNTTKTNGSGGLSNIFTNFGIASYSNATFGNNVPYTLKVIEPPGALPAGMRLLSPVYHVHFDDAVAAAYSVALKATSPERMTCTIGGGVYAWQNPSWVQLSEGIGSGWNAADVSSSDAMVAILVKSGGPQVPEIVSVSHKNPTDLISPANPLIIKVKNPFGLDLQQTDVVVGGQRIWEYSPVLGEYPNWSVVYSGDVATLTYTPPAGWSHSSPLYGYIKVAGSFGSLPALASIGQKKLTAFPWWMILPAIISNENKAIK